MIRLEPQPRHWIGLSTDGKPIPGQTTSAGDLIQAADVTPGTTFLESDTNVTATWNGSAWVSVPNDTSVLTQLQVNGDELFRIRRLLEIANDLDSNDYLT